LQILTRCDGFSDLETMLGWVTETEETYLPGSSPFDNNSKPTVEEHSERKRVP
jgi:hypothetical protein